MSLSVVDPNIQLSLAFTFEVTSNAILGNGELNVEQNVNSIIAITVDLTNQFNVVKFD